MPLTDVSHGERDVDPDKVEQMDLIRAVQNHLPKRTYDKIIRTFDNAVNSTADNHQNLVWTTAGCLFGYGSKQPHADINHAWEKIIGIVGPDKFCKMTVGAILQWRIAIRARNTNENWYCYKIESDELDPETDKPITRTEYWIKP